MGFPSPAQDYVERPLCLNELFNVNGNTVVIETSSGWDVTTIARCYETFYRLTKPCSAVI